MEEYLAFAQKLARKGGKLIKDNFRANLKVEVKHDNTPVTETDRAINELVVQAIAKTYPDHGLLGEEADYGTGKEELQWLLDPLDGTRSFILGIPVTTFILGLTRGGEILLSVVYNPFTDRLHHAVRGKGAFCGSEPLKVNDQRLEDGGCVLVSESSFQYAKSLCKEGAQIEPLPGAGYRAMVLADGRCSGIIQTGADFHDVGPASLIIEEAGGKVTDLSGQKMHFDKPITNGIILSNGVAHDRLVKLIAKSPS